MWNFLLGNVILGDEKGGLPKQNLCPEILIDTECWNTEYRNNGKYMKIYEIMKNNEKVPPISQTQCQ